MKEDHYCGCCGRETNGDLWCKDCLSHIAPYTGQYLWDRTYFAQHDKDCPFQNAAKNLAETNIQTLED